MTDTAAGAVTWPGGLYGAVLLACAFAVLTAIIEGIVKLVAPPEEQDPRLGYVAFWLVVAVVALATPVLEWG